MVTLRSHAFTHRPARDKHLPWVLLTTLASGQIWTVAELALRLGLAPSSVRRQLARLRVLGVEISPQPGAGYALREPIELLDAERIRGELTVAARRTCRELSVLPEVDSTNAELLRRQAVPAPAWRACLAELQTRGRGRRGRRWRMPPAGGLAISVLRSFDVPLRSLAGLSLCAGIAAAEALESCGLSAIGLKWPNDLMVERRKLGGVLVELGGSPRGFCQAVIGIGINYRLGGMSRSIDQPAVDVEALSGSAAPSRNALAAALLSRLVEALESFAGDGFEPFVKAWEARDLLRGRAVRVETDVGPRFGVARGVDGRGALRVQFVDGERSVEAAAVSLRSAR